MKYIFKGLLALSIGVALTACNADTGLTSTNENPVTTNAMTKNSTIRFEIKPLRGLPAEAGVSRRDPSDVILHDGVYYLWYTKSVTMFGGYDATIWYATSKDGVNWQEQSESLARGSADTWDSHSVFTPNILKAENKFYLFYTGVTHTPGFSAGVFKNDLTNDYTAIGLAVADTPNGPFTRVSSDPILAADKSEPTNFDSYRVDDAALIAKDGQYLLYYKGRSISHGRKGPKRTKMGVAIASDPAGPYQRYEGNPIIKGGHEVMVWPANNGVMALLSNVGKVGETLQFAAESTDFSHFINIPKDYPHAPGFYRSDDFVPGQNVNPQQLWGVSMSYGTRPNKVWPHLMRFDIVVTP